MHPQIQKEIERYLQTGEYDCLFSSFDGTDIVDRCRRGHMALAESPKNEVVSRAHRVDARTSPMIPQDLRGMTRAKVEPMVRGLFTKAEQASVLSLVESSVIVLQPSTIKSVVDEEDLNTAWKLSILYLLSIGAEPISPEAPSIVGMSVNTKCYVATSYFDECESFDDYVVHEAAHLFHNVKRKTIGLKSKRNKEWLLPIAYRMREAFAYSCEVYMALRRSVQDRRSKLEQVKKTFVPNDERVDVEQFYSILSEAIEPRSGWKVILSRCSNPCFKTEAR